jgi:hypothetical protein
MEDELFALLYRLVCEEAKLRIRSKGCRHSDRLILLVFFWAVLHDRPISWACQIRHWSSQYQWLQLPSQPTMSRRLRRLSLILLMMGLYHRLRQVPQDPGQVLPGLCRRIDSKPLVVGGFSKDRDARRGYATGGMARGYKCFAAWGRAVVPDGFGLGPMNQADPNGAGKLIDTLEGTGYLLADAGHDVNPLHQQAADRGFQLLTPRKQPGRGLGHRPHSAARLRSIERMEGPSPFARQLYADRDQIERHFGQWTSFGGGLQPLPSWVRRPRRVGMWVLAKLILNGLRICRNKRLTA